MSDELQYLSGFGNEFQSEALSGALPIARFSPQRPALGLYAEKFSATAFTVPRQNNRRLWFYRIRPSATQGMFAPYPHPLLGTAPLDNARVPINPMRWSAPTLQFDHDFVDGLVTIAANGNVAMHSGIGVHLFACGRPMANRCFVNYDAETVLVPQSGMITMQTECGTLAARPGDIAVVPRGMKFKVDPDSIANGYVCENYGQYLRLPERGPIGSDGLANTRDFETPVARFSDVQEPWEIIGKSHGVLHRAEIRHNPFDVVGWIGNAVPYRYDLTRFNAMGSISFDHPDPSIFTVLTAPSEIPGTANMDLVIFPPRWLVAEDTFRPPYFHRNVMSEFMGLLYGQYDAKAEGFEPGGMSLHNVMTPHGPDAEATAAASEAALEPRHLAETLAFMFETRFALSISEWAASSPALQQNYSDCWQDIGRNFTPR